MTDEKLTNRHFEQFVELSVELTGFTAAELASTGMARAYFDELAMILGEPLAIAFLDEAKALKKLMGEPLYRPIALNVVRMWYLGQWTQLGGDAWLAKFANCSQDRKDKFDDFGRNTTHLVSAEAYREGLVWSAIGTHPSGAKQPGFASWEAPPQ